MAAPAPIAGFRSTFAERPEGRKQSDKIGLATRLSNRGTLI
jgi:hypothetical protein